MKKEDRAQALRTEISGLVQALAVARRELKELIGDQNDLWLISYNPDQKINTIKAVRALTNLGLRESLFLVNTAPICIKTDVSTLERLSTAVQWLESIAQVEWR